MDRTCDARLETETCTALSIGPLYHTPHTQLLLCPRRGTIKRLLTGKATVTLCLLLHHSKMLVDQISNSTANKMVKVLNGDITSDAHWHWRDAIFAVIEREREREREREKHTDTNLRTLNRTERRNNTKEQHSTDDFLAASSVSCIHDNWQAL